MKVEILSVGTELLMGQIANTNAQYISGRVPEAGLGVFYHSVVGDNPERLSECLKLALSRSDVIITTGGLGPTQDDLTKDVVAQTLGLKMVIHEKSRQRIKEYFESRGRVMVESNFRQAYFPEGSIILENDAGTAPGCIIEYTMNDKSEKTIILLPGPPKEMKPMFDKLVIKYLKNRSANHMVSRFVCVVGVGESLVEQQIMELVEGQTNPTFATYAKDGIVTIRITASDEGGNADIMVDAAAEKIKRILGDSVYTIDNEEIENTVFNLLKNKKMKFACAESCTGGMLASIITSIPGASSVFEGGCVTYSPESKVALLGVNPETIEKHGAVSSETALEMVNGVYKNTAADIAVSITGLAGPGVYNDSKPIGLVYIAIKTKDFEKVHEFRFSGTRDRIRTLSVINALNIVRLALLKKV